MERPALDTFACVKTACQVCRQPGQGTLIIRQVSGHDHLRLWRCHRCGEACSERRGTALFNTKRPEVKAEAVVRHLDDGCSVRATACLVQGAKETVARLPRQAGRQAERCHNQPVHGLTPKVLACDVPWSCVKKSRSGATPPRRRGLAIGGTTPRSRRIGSWWSPS